MQDERISLDSFGKSASSRLILLERFLLYRKGETGRQKNTERYNKPAARMSGRRHCPASVHSPLSHRCSVMCRIDINPMYVNPITNRIRKGIVG